MNLQSLIKATDFEHSRKVSQISKILARYAGYTQEESRVICEASSFHDIGKCGIAKEILNKPGPLTEREFNIIKTHTSRGRDKIKEALRILSAAELIAGSHHEKLDGTGYQGLASNEIHPYARLVSVADVFDALYSKRPYKNAWDINDIAKYFKRQSGTQFDIELASILLQHINEIAAIYQ